MRKTFEELNQEYVPNNGSTNFSNSTCRRRLLDKFIGEGKWSYVYEGRKVVAVEVLTDEPETEVVEDEIIEEVVAEESVESEEILTEEDPTTEAEYTRQMNQLKSLVDGYENRLKTIRDRISHLENMHHKIGSVKHVFEGISFRKYSWTKVVLDNANEIMSRYDENRNRPGIEEALNEVAKKLLNQARKSVGVNDYRFKYYKYSIDNDGIHRSNFSMYDESTWESYYKHIWEYRNNSFNNYTCESYRKNFDIDTKAVISDIKILEKVIAVGKNLIDTDDYKFIAKSLDYAKRYLAKANELLSTKESMYKKFCNGYSDYVSRKQAEESNSKRYRRSTNSDDWFSNRENRDKFWEEFNRAFGGGYSGRTSSSSSSSTFKYFTGTYASAKDVKSAYRTFAKSLHPDHGGDEAEFKAMYAEYERMMKRFVA